LLRGHHPEGEACVDDLGAERLAGGDSALGQRLESRFAREGHPLLDRVERPPVEEVGRVDDVPCLRQFLGERAHAVGEALDVVIEHDFGHSSSSVRSIHYSGTYRSYRPFA
jgi:hypothetical protein